MYRKNEDAIHVRLQPVGVSGASPYRKRACKGRANKMGEVHFLGIVDAKAHIIIQTFCLLLILLISSAIAAENTMKFDMPAQPLETALKLFSKQSGVKVTLPESQCKECRAHSVSGSLTPTDALHALLADTGLTFICIEKGSVTLVLSENGMAGKSTDITMRHDEITVIGHHVVTEGTKSYTSSAVTVAGKEPLSMREIPGSVSVITRQQMDDRNMVNLADAMEQSTGVSLSPGSDLYATYYYARGYIMNEMTDGMAEINGRYHQWDLGIYDRIEVIRGPYGLLQGGSLHPTGSINLVKKQPLDRFAFSANASLGSWESYSGTFDVTGPLLRNKKVRGRLVMSGRDRNFFWDGGHEKKWTGYGAIQADITRRTTFSLGLVAQETNNPGYSGNPSFTDGRQLPFARSFSPYPEWNRYIRNDQEAIAGIEHKFDSGWGAKFRLRDSKLDTTTHEAYPGTGVDPNTMTLDFNRRAIEYTYRWFGTDIYVSGPFRVFNRTHNLLFGWNYDRWTSESYTSGGVKVKNISIFNIAGPGLTDEIRPPYTQGTNYDYWQDGFYGKLQLKVFEPLSVVLGGRIGDYTSQTRYVYPSTPTPWTSGYQAHNQFTKYGGVVYDVTKRISLYGSYSDIFVPQTSGSWPDNKPLDPRAGEQSEIGSKGEFFNKKLNASLALFLIRDKNRAYEDPDHPNYYISRGEVETKGIEAEATGSPLTGLDITAGYTYATTVYEKDSTRQGQDVNMWSPTQMFKLWALYRFQKGHLRNLSLGAGANAYSESKAAGTNYMHIQPSYAVFNAQAGCQISENLKATLTFSNISDKKYYASVGSLYVNNIYGTPRSFTLTLRKSI
jgi:outer-membrane receptor for ferric coprogen and ferric-rhodotorulic acid